jgi:hypothetical protein
MTKTIGTGDSLLRPVEIDGLERLGAPNDGGYVVPVQAIMQAKTLLAFGVSIDWSFERACIRRNPQLAVLAYDHSVGPAFFLKFGAISVVALIIRLLAGDSRRMRLSVANIRSAIDYFVFFRGQIRHVRKRVWHSADPGSESIETILATAGKTGPGSVFAKIDIEGAEYRILPAVLKHANLFTGLAIEFHDTDLCAEPLGRLVGELRNHFHVAHLHGNNYSEPVAGSLPTAIEVTLINKALVSGSPAPYTGALPRPGLDAPNDPLRPDLALHL